MGNRLQLRLTTRCNNGCVHCTLQDVRRLVPSDRSLEKAVAWLVWCRRQYHCDELVLLRGEVTLRSELPTICRQARRSGYTLVQVQSNGRRFADRNFARQMVRHGLTDAEVDLYGPNAEIHDAIAQTPGAFEQTAQGLSNLLELGVGVRINIPLLAVNTPYLCGMVSYLCELGVRDIQFNFVRPTRFTSPKVLTTLSEVRLPLYDALALGRALGSRVTTEAIPFCILGSYRGHASDANSSDSADSRTVVVDLHRTVVESQVLRSEYRAGTTICAECRWFQTCPKTWSAYVKLWGGVEFEPEK